MAGNGLDSSKARVCALPGCEQPVAAGPAAGPPRLYCCKQHRAEARKHRYEARTSSAAAAPKPKRNQRDTAVRRSDVLKRHAKVLRPPEPEPPVEPPPAARPVRRRRRQVRTALALLTCAVTASVLLPGDVGTLPTPVQPPLGAAPAEAAPPLVNARWLAQAQKVLRKMDRQLADIGRAERAARALPASRWSPRLRGLMRTLARHKAALLKIAPKLRSDLAAVERYGQTRDGLAKAQSQLGALKDAHQSLSGLVTNPGEGAADIGRLLRVLGAQTEKLLGQIKAFEAAERLWRRAIEEVNGQPLPELPGDAADLVEKIIDETRPPPGPSDSPGPGNGPPSTRPPGSVENPPGNDDGTGAPPNPPKKKPPEKTPEPPKPAPPKQDPPTPTPPPDDPPKLRPRIPFRPGPSGGGGSSEGGDHGINTDPSSPDYGTSSDSGGSDPGRESDPGSDGDPGAMGDPGGGDSGF